MEDKLLILLSIISYVLAGSRNIMLTLDRYATNHTDPEIVAAMESNITERNNRFYLNFMVEPAKVLKKVDVRIVMEFSRPNVKTLTVFDTKLDMCSLVDTLGTHKIFQNVLIGIKTALNVLPTCPLKSHFQYKLIDYHFREDLLPSYTPLGKFRIMSTAYVGDLEVLDYLVEGRIVKKKL